MVKVRKICEPTCEISPIICIITNKSFKALREFEFIWWRYCDGITFLHGFPVRTPTSMGNNTSVTTSESWYQQGSR